jgi:Tol biopolymer transport system component/predicted Ser/Thr protein kinase
VIGRTIGSYEILARLGAGGMGEVYRARDSKLKREVAIKVLPADVAGNPERLARFQREAEVLASLNHPHIAHVYGIEENALVMELVEGEDLSQRIARGAIPIDEALPIAKQIAEALEAAHEAGIVHRDLKPANVKVRPDGTVKVLDFGLAKALEPGSGLRPPGSAQIADSPTITSPAMTVHGMILGTAAYMSPEQAKGRPVDRRADIWAFGCVLYEMLTGTRAFNGDDVTDIITSVMRDRPDWSALPPTTPAAMLTLLRRCLEKDPRNRAPHIAIARMEIADAMTTTGELVGRAPAPAARSTAWPIAAAALTVAALAVGWASSRYFAAAPPAPGSMSLSTLLVEENLNARAPSQRLALSPDGRHLAYVGGVPEGRMQLYLRSLDRAAGQPLAGTDGAIGPFWSHDSRYIAFRSGNELKKIDIAGGPPITIIREDVIAATVNAYAQQGMPGTWNADDVIVYSNGSVIRRVSAMGGPSEAVTTLDAAANETQHDFPHFLPDGRHFLYAAFSGLRPAGTFVASLDGRVKKRIVDDSGNAQFASGYLLFLRGSSIMAQPFDPSGHELSGEATPIIEAVMANVTTRPGAAYAASRDGTLVYQTALGLSGTRLAWSTRAGQQTLIADDPWAYRDLALSPDGTMAAIAPLDEGGRSDIWLLNLARGGRTKLTTTGTGQSAVFSPDGKSVVYSAITGGSADLFRKRADGSGNEERLFEAPGFTTPTDWSPDGKVLLFDMFSPATNTDVMALPLDGAAKPAALLGSRFAERWGQFSPDGKWIAYGSDDSGTREVFLTRFGGGGRWQVSTRSGNYPRWSRDGREVFFYSAVAGKIMAARVDTRGDTAKIDTPVALFDARAPEGFGRYFYDVAPDGRFLMAGSSSPTTMATVTLAVNWPAMLQRAPVVKTR